MNEGLNSREKRKRKETLKYKDTGQIREGYKLEKYKKKERRIELERYKGKGRRKEKGRYKENKRQKDCNRKQIIGEWKKRIELRRHKKILECTLFNKFTLGTRIKLLLGMIFTF